MELQKCGELGSDCFRCKQRVERKCTRLSYTRPRREESLYVGETIVIWSSGPRILKSFRTDERVHQAVWCSFADFNNNTILKEWLCILHAESLTVHRDDGEMYHIALPCRLSLSGLLIERKIGKEESGKNPDAPLLFSLMHPLEVLKPVSQSLQERGVRGALAEMKKKQQQQHANAILATPLEMTAKRRSRSNSASSSSSSSSSSNYLRDPCEKVVFSFESRPLLVTYNTEQHVHKLWVMHQSLAEINKRFHANRLDKNDHDGEDDNTDGEAWGRRNGTTAAGGRLSVAKHSSDSKRKIDLMEIEGGGEREEVEEEDEEATRIESEVILDLVWVQSERTAISKVFLARDEASTPLLCLFDKQQKTLRAYRLKHISPSTTATASSSSSSSSSTLPPSKIRVELAFMLEGACSAAVPIMSARCLYRDSIDSCHTVGTSRWDGIGWCGLVDDNDDENGDPFNHDILVLSENGELLHLYTGATLIGTIDLKAAFSSRVIDVQESNRDKITVLFDTGKELRMKVATTPFSRQGLISACFAAIELLVDPEFHHALLHDFLLDCELEKEKRAIAKREDEEEKKEEKEKKSRDAAPSSSRHESSSSSSSISRKIDYWKVFCTMLDRLAGSEDDGEMAMEEEIESDDDGSDEDNDNSHWERLLKSDMHAMSSLGPAVYLPLTTMKTTTAAKSSKDKAKGQRKQRSKKKVKKGPQKKKKRAYRAFEKATAKQGSLLIPNSSSSSSSSSSTTTTLRLVLRALHTLYENYKLDVLRKSEHLRLLPLLKGLARAAKEPAFLDQYLRDSDQVSIPQDKEEEEEKEKEGEGEEAASDRLRNNKQQVPANVFQWLVHCVRSGDDSTSSSSRRPPPHPLNALPASIRIYGSFLLPTLYADGGGEGIMVGSGGAATATTASSSANRGRHRGAGGGGGFPFHRLRRICRLYSVLFSSSPPYSSSAATTVDEHKRMRMMAVTTTPGSSRQATPCTSTSSSLLPPQRRRFMIHPPSPLAAPIPFQTTQNSGNSSGSKTPPLVRAGAYGYQTTRSPYPLLSPSSTRPPPRQCTARSREEQLVIVMVEEGLSIEDLDELPFGVALPLRQALCNCRENPPTGWPPAAYKLIRREDLATLFETSSTNAAGAGGSSSSGGGVVGVRRGHPGTGSTRGGGGGGASGRAQPLSSLQIGSVLGQNSMSRTMAAAAASSAAAAAAETPQQREALRQDYGNEVDGTSLVLRQSLLRFGRDKRIKEVCRILRSNRLIRMNVPAEHSLNGGGEGQGDNAANGGPGSQSWKQLQLFRRIIRTLALPVGRGMLTLGSYIPDLTEALAVPRLVVKGILPPKDIPVSLDYEHAEVVRLLTSMGGQNTLRDWPGFHNGVAAGLRVVIPAGGGGQNGGEAYGRSSSSPSSSSAAEITRTWIAYNRPRKLTYTHAGFLLGLGLRGHLNALAPSDLCVVIVCCLSLVVVVGYWYLSQDHDATIMAILLGMAAGCAGTTDVRVSKMLCLRIPALLPPAFADLAFSAVTQTAALVGIGLLYRGTAHRLMTELLLTEIGNRPADEKWADQGHEAYSLAAGLALGLVCLQRGADAIGLADLQIQNRLRQYMDGGPSHGYGGTVFRTGSLGRDEAGGGSSSGGSRMKEGRMVNVDVTAPGAIAALGLMYMRSGNRAIANYLATPDTHFALDYVRPDFIMFRVVAQNLVLWSQIRPLHDWVLDQIPDIINNNIQPITTQQQQQQLRSSLDGDGEDTKGDDGDDNGEMDVEKKEEEKPTMRRKKSKLLHNVAGSVDLDLEAIRQSYCYIIAGACLSIGLRFAGTGDEPSQQLVTYYLRQLLELRRFKIEGASALPKNLPPASKREGLHRLIIQGRVMVERGVLEACIATTASALGMVMAGTGNLDTLRILRAARTMVDAKSSFGTHQTVHMAIGLLFLGGGQLTLSSTPEATAALLCAFFPRYSMHPGDNRYYLQALRHLYVVAVEPRCIQCVDVNTGQPCYVPIDLILANDGDDVSEEKKGQGGGESKFIASSTTSPSSSSTKGKITGRASASSSSSSAISSIRNNRTLRVVAPCLLPPFHSVKTLKVSSPKFWPINLHLRGDGDLLKMLKRKQLVLCVKRKEPHLRDDDGTPAIGVMTNFSSSSSTTSSSAAAAAAAAAAVNEDNHGIAGQSTSRLFKKFRDHFSTRGAEGRIGRICGEIGKECEVEERILALPSYVSIASLLDGLLSQKQQQQQQQPEQHGNGGMLDLWNLRLSIEYSRSEAAAAANRHKGHHHSRSSSSSSSPPHHHYNQNTTTRLLGLDFLNKVAVQVDEHFNSQSFTSALTRFVVAHERKSSSSSSSLSPQPQKTSGENWPKGFALQLGYYDFPLSHEIWAGMAKARKLVSMFRAKMQSDLSPDIFMLVATMAWPQAPVTVKMKLADCLRIIVLNDMDSNS
eukprot:jgi/Bigna1/69308/fgenesh1_pg.8_\